MFFSDQVGMMGPGEEGHRSKGPLSSHLIRVVSSPWLITVEVDLDHLPSVQNPCPVKLLSLTTAGQLCSLGGGCYVQPLH